ncbi:MAG TPA: hypothetical protein VGN07_02620 [Steroidobacteraceae bacterium]
MTMFKLNGVTRAREGRDAKFRSRIPVFGRVSAALVLATMASVGAEAQVAVTNQGFVPYSDAPIYYRTAMLTDPVTQLKDRIAKGRAQLKYKPDHGYLESVLKLLDIPVDSQTLVFSKTSFQYSKISPDHPRALYFNDDVYIGAVHDGKAIEVVSFDPMQGAVFYLLDEPKAKQPNFERAELDCTQCHIASGTRGIPGVLLQSVYPAASGTVAAGTRTYITDQQSPYAQRWGGWYVNGLNSQGTLANAVVPDGDANADDKVRRSRSVIPLPANSFDASRYLYSGSDVVAHLVLAHQTQMHNLITLVNYKTRIAINDWEKAHPGDKGRTDVDYPEGVRSAWEKPAERLLRYLLFSKEAALGELSADLKPENSQFAKTFSAKGPRDPQHRSLRDFDLKTRTFRYPCSYLIYSEHFDHIPQPARSYVYRRLLEVLTNQDNSSDFSHLTVQDRNDILAILLATKKGLPQEWYANAPQGTPSLAAAARPAASGF